MNFDVKSNIKAMIRYELLTGKPFQKIDYGNESDVEDMLYCAILCSNSELITKEEFFNIAENESILNDMAAKLKRNISIIHQFMQQQAEINEGGTDNETNYIKDIASTLIISGGIDAEYLLHQMDVCDLPIYIEAYERHKREEMESSRLWTYYNMLPHIDKKKIKTPKDIIPFPWELEKLKKEAELSLKRDKELFEQFMSGQMIDINNINWTKRDN